MREPKTGQRLTADLDSLELGQILALVAILIAISYWRKSGNFLHHAYKANAFMMMLGFLLMFYQITGYIVQ